MGDTGSLSLGGSLAAIAIIVKHEIVLAIVGGLFVLETVSVIIQVVSFKLTLGTSSRISAFPFLASLIM